MGDQEELNETSLPQEENFYSHLNRKITDVDYTLTKQICKVFKLKQLGEYLDVYVESNTLLSADAFENF